MLSAVTITNTEFVLLLIFAVIGVAKVILIPLINWIADEDANLEERSNKPW